MWWLFLNAGQISTLIAATTVMPHYTVTFGIIFEFVVLGVVPGTNIELDFLASLVIWLVLCSFYLFYRLIKQSPKNAKFAN
jgi:hypothetical protein